jgi:hypothetical protein
VRARTHLATAIAAGAVGVSCASGLAHLAGTNAAQAKPSRVYTLRIGDLVLIPSVGQRCDVEVEGGAPELFCSRGHAARHQVTFFRDIILVWKVGNPDHEAWSGKP